MPEGVSFFVGAFLESRRDETPVLFFFEEGV